jgi:hypothetical protein
LLEEIEDFDQKAENQDHAGRSSDGPLFHFLLGHQIMSERPLFGFENQSWVMDCCILCFAWRQS